MANHWSSYVRGERKQRGQMNRTEMQFAALLEAQKAAGEIVAYWYEAMTYKLTETPSETCSELVAGQVSSRRRTGTRYTPDFSVMLSDDRLIHYEVKGTGVATTADINRVKAAAEKYPFRFYLATKRTKKAGGGFEIEEL